MKNVKKIGYAVLGLGIGMAHAEAAAASAHAELVALCDLDEARLQKAAALYPDATLYTDVDAMLADPRVDIVSICLPSAMHADYAVRAMEAGKHVLSEIPVIETLEEAKILRDAVKSHPELKYMAGENCFYWAFIKSSFIECEWEEF